MIPFKSDEELRDESAGVQRDFLKTGLSLAANSADLAKRSYQRGRLQEGDLSKVLGDIALRTVRYFVAKTDVLSGAEIDSITRRCDELEQIFAKMDQAK